MGLILRGLFLGSNRRKASASRDGSLATNADRRYTSTLVGDNDVGGLVTSPPVTLRQRNFINVTVSVASRLLRLGAQCCTPAQLDYTRPGSQRECTGSSIVIRPLSPVSTTRVDG